MSRSFGKSLLLSPLKRYSNFSTDLFWGKTKSVSMYRSYSIVSCIDCKPGNRLQNRENPSSQLPYLCKAQSPQQRCLSTSSSKIDDTFIQSHDGYLSVKHGEELLDLPYVWLRDHCQCQECFNRNLFQKNIDNYKLTPDIRPCRVEVEDNGVKLKLTWQDGHVTEYDIQWLSENSFSSTSRSKTPPLLWDSAKIHAEPLPVVAYETYNKGDEGIKKTMFNLLKYGFSIIEGVGASIHDTKDAVEKITFIHKTLFGEMWSFTADQSRSDTAFTNISLGAHTDTTYYTCPAGLQVFHGLMHDGKGGDTLLVDGFNAAEQLRDKDPNAFNNLTKQIVPHEYREPDTGNHLLSYGTVLTVHPASQKLTNIRFNPYDRAPLDTVSPNEIQQFYADYEKLKSHIQNPKNEFWFKLHPGMVLIVNNWRTLHGRSAFTGNRMLCGCYLPWDDWTSRARHFGLI